MTTENPQGPTEWDAMHPYASLTPDAVLDALADIGLMGDGRLTALSSYENRVYQIQLETERSPTQSNGTPVPDSVVAKFYRPGRWTDAQIQEEHDFAAELVAAEVPVVPPLPNCKVPALMVVSPVYVLVPARINLPAPSLVKPLLPLMTPLSVMLPVVLTDDAVAKATVPA